MGSRDPRVDAYVAKSAAFAKPILRRLRAQIHDSCPDAVEAIKWNMPMFLHHGILCYMAAFKAHCAFGFWKHSLVVDAPRDVAVQAMGGFGRIETARDLPVKSNLEKYIKKAMALNEAGVPSPTRSKPRRTDRPQAPAYLLAALKRQAKASVQWKLFTAGRQREYIDWLTEAKTSTTRDNRLKQAMDWIAAGKARNWKYERC